MTFDRNTRASRVLLSSVAFTILTAAAWAAPAPSSVGQYLGGDTGTQGNWVGHYGTNGYMIANGPSQNPRNGTVSVIGAQTYTWAGLTTDPRALQSDPQDNPPVRRIASAFTQYQSKGFTIHYTSLPNVPETVLLYMLDWDTTTRTQVVTVTDASTNALLDGPRTFSNFHNGVYIGYLVNGNVNISVTPVGYGIPAVSGVFFGISSNLTTQSATVKSARYSGAGSSRSVRGTEDDSSGSTGDQDSPVAVGFKPLSDTTTLASQSAITVGSGSSASFAGLDSSTQGSWKGVYGANGYQIANDGSKAPTYATTKVDGDPTEFIYTWAALTTDPRALQIGNSTTGRIASEYTNYQSKNFTVSVNINDGGTHPVALYMLDWDSTTRMQIITIRDLSTGTLLDTEVISNFHNGVYATWNIKGNVVITVQATGYTTPSVSGLFFN